MEVFVFVSSSKLLFEWLNVLTFFALFECVSEATTNIGKRINTFLCWVWLVTFMGTDIWMREREEG